MKKITNINIDNKKVIVRVDYNVPIKNGKVEDNNRIKASLKTINYLKEHNAKIILLSHIGKIKTEEELNQGYADIFIEGNKDYMNHDIIIELKYIKKSEYNKEILEEKIEEGKKQLNKYGLDERIKEKVYKYIVVFVGNEIKCLEGCD